MYLITQSLISSLNYLYDCAETSKDEAYEEFLRTLRREPSEPNDNMRNGIEFENEVYKVAHGVQRQPHPKWEDGIQAVATRIMGAPNQLRAERTIEIDGAQYLVYGILDALNAGEIFDVKFSNKSFGSVDLAGKYLTSVQHSTYFYLVPEAYKFTYLVSDGKDLYTEIYYRNSTRPFEEILRQFLTSLEALGLMEIYREKWQAR